MSHAVLLVDDEKNILQAYKRLLRDEDCELLLADGGAAAVEFLRNREIAVIICDQRMPGLTGAEVLAEAYRLQPDAVRITLTGHTDVAAAQASVNEGHVALFLFKPWDDAQVRGTVRSGIATYRAGGVGGADPGEGGEHRIFRSQEVATACHEDGLQHPQCMIAQKIDGCRISAAH